MKSTRFTTYTSQEENLYYLESLYTGTFSVSKTREICHCKKIFSY